MDCIENHDDDVMTLFKLLTEKNVTQLKKSATAVIFSEKEKTATEMIVSKKNATDMKPVSKKENVVTLRKTPLGNITRQKSTRTKFLRILAATGSSAGPILVGFMNLCFYFSHAVILHTVPGVVPVGKEVSDVKPIYESSEREESIGELMGKHRDGMLLHTESEGIHFFDGIFEK